MTICDDLRQSVLQAAIQGKLTQQLPEDGSAADLLASIKAEKEQLIKEKKIKKETPLAPISEDEIPFDIPDNWEWCRLNDISLMIGDIDHKMPPTVTSGGVPYVSPLNFTKDGKIDYDGAKHISIANYEQLSKKCAPSKNDIIFPRYGTIGVVRIVETDQPFLASYSCCTIKNFGFNFMSYKYVYYVLNSSLIQSEIVRYTNKTTQPNVGLQSIKQFLFPLPPLAEQHRIVARVNELMAKIDKLETVEKELVALKKAFPGDMKASLLQSAMQGKLTQQLPEDGSAADLLASIGAEKEQLIKEKKIKKQKPLEPISEDEIPFEIPDNWEWVRLGEIGTWGAGATPQKGEPKYYKGGTIPWLITGELNNGYVSKIEGKITEYALEHTSVKLNPVGSVLIAMYGATIGKLGILSVAATTNQACCACYPYKGVFNRFLFYFLMANKRMYLASAEGGAQPNISKEKIVNTLMPLPPIAEQHRIVEKLDKLLPLCDALSEEGVA